MVERQGIRVGFTLTQLSHKVPGGSARAALDLLQALTEFQELAMTPLTARPRRADAPDNLQNERSLRLHYAALYELWNRTSFTGSRSAFSGLDVVHCTLAFAPPVRTPLVVTIHDLFPLSNPEQFTARGARVMAAGLRRAVERADLVICPTHAVAAEVAELGVGPDRLRVAHWGVDTLAVDDIAVEDMRRRHQLQGRYLLFVGALVPRKNVSVLIDAMTKLDADLQLVVVGPDGWNGEPERLRSRAGQKVRFLGQVQRADLHALLRDAVALCIPSFREGFGLPAAEAMSHGTPVLHSLCPALSEVVGAGGIGTDARDVDGWAEAIARIDHDPELRTRLSVAASDRSGDFTWQRSAEQHHRAYASLVS